MLPLPNRDRWAANQKTMHTIFQNELLVIFGTILIGHLVGMIGFRGISLGNSACLFVALLFGALGAKISPVVTDIGIVLFVYSVGSGFKSIISSLPTVPPFTFPTFPSIDVPTSQQTSTSKPTSNP